MAATLHLICAGAAQGLVGALREGFTAQTGATLHATFGAVGAMKDLLSSGAPCDVFVSTDAMQIALAADGVVLDDTRKPLGRVRTGVAVRVDQPHPDVSTASALKAALSAADSVYFPDAVKSTAGIHFAKVMSQLGVLDTLQPRFKTFPNGATAMREMAQSTSAQPIGCTQVTEILYTPGVQLVAMLPPEFELATVYAAAITTRSQATDLAQRFIDHLTGAAAQALRQQGGFES